MVGISTQLQEAPCQVGHAVHCHCSLNWPAGCVVLLLCYGRGGKDGQQCLTACRLQARPGSILGKALALQKCWHISCAACKGSKHSVCCSRPGWWGGCAGWECAGRRRSAGAGGSNGGGGRSASAIIL
jgi:hypothetical protein